MRGRGGDTRDVGQVVYEIVAEATGSAVSDLADGDRLDDLGVTGLVLLDVVETVEEELGERTLGVSIDDDALAAVQTLGELVALVREGLA